MKEFLSPGNIALSAVGVVAGILVGATPGLSVTMAVALLASMTYSWDTKTALALMLGVYAGGVYGGSRSSILINIPGTPSALATSFDGHPMALRGEAGLAIGVATVQSVIGGFIGLITLILAAPPISELALKFAPRDYFLLVAMGLSLTGRLAGGSLARSMVGAALGVLVGLIGMDPITGEGRFTFGQPLLINGVHFIAAVIGLFGVSEVIYQLGRIGRSTAPQARIAEVGGVFPGFRHFFKYLPVTIRASVIGVIVGALPGAGGDIAALLAYADAKRWVKKPSRPFGQGAVEGVVAPETANNACIGGDMIPMLTLGIPGDAVTAVLISVLFIHGLRPGPLLMVEQRDLFWFIAGSYGLANIFLFVFGLLAVRPFVKVVNIDKRILMPLIVLISVVGTYAIQNNIYDVFWMIGFGVLGYFMKLGGYPVGPMVLGVILGPLADINFRRAMLAVQGNVPLFLWEMVSHPISLVLTLILLSAFVPSVSFAGVRNWIRLRRMRREVA
ncbi:MAG: tripartite tricarboxylate transporter permease [Armatimonadota bacterium]|nr:tripartite tricarboxylate transporter permease [Armatimonadota bacterium]MDR7451063.1 tripartite tricarboxylate transporter permease [Armatimonadota bacterium]MDR7465916.1 tripartite tricarboxylate transporter permease [Armatimonadota bacterium]MDR7493981.1 tripartite tricarboxylate transporter permease [Armatimonadota bacterium]MDR7498431.1 tripartite tricarboxylate transporter permease [Armatimonadota bacterium]